ncbi:MAG: hypothetical protein ACRCYU_12015 [Nocardioides sp.]
MALKVLDPETQNVYIFGSASAASWFALSGDKTWDDVHPQRPGDPAPDLTLADLR